MRIRLADISTRSTRRILHAVHESLAANTLATTWRRSTLVPNPVTPVVGRRPLARYGDQIA